MNKASRPFQIFVKPVGSLCNLGCSYCYYLEKERLFSMPGSFLMPDEILESYISQHINASPALEIRFSWHGGEPTLLGVDYFHKIVEMQKRHGGGKRVLNGIQTNGTLLTEEWCRFLAKERFSVGISMDGPEKMHDRHRLTKKGDPTHKMTMTGYNLLRQHGITPDILCVVNSNNVKHPMDVYHFFKEIKAGYIGFLPLVERQTGYGNGVSPATVPSRVFGEFLCEIFDEWQERDIGKIRVQIFEETSGTALEKEHELCIFRQVCGDVPVIEHNGDFFSCDHFVDPGHHLGNIGKDRLVDLIESPEQTAFGRYKLDGLPRYCRSCEVLAMCNGECPKNRFILTPDGEKGLNYLCEGYRLFFNHCRPFLDQLSSLWHGQPRERGARTPAGGAGRGRAKTGRNDPCPCGSGKKYKKCCLGK